MDEKNQYSGDYTENSQEQPSPKKPKKKTMTLKKVFLVALAGGIIGGGAVIGGYALYDQYSSQAVTQDNRKGKTVTSNIKVTETNQATKAFNKVKNAVVSVEAYSSSDNSLDSLFGNFEGGKSTKETSESEGSGVIYKKDGNTAFIVTNNHVISGSNKVEVLLSNGKKLPATIVGHDAISDLAVLKINAQDVTEVASFGNSNDIQVGQTALAIGSPLGSEYATSLTKGIISAKKRTIDVTNSQGVTTGQETVIQTDAAINPGNSGGPLINLAGQVIGINSMKLSSTGTGSGSSTSVEGMGFAIPSNEVVSIINQLVTNGKVIRPALGISLIDLSNIPEEQQQSVLKLPNSVNGGIVVAKINDNSPLKGSGIQKGDVIVSLGGKKVTGLASLREALYSHKLGSTVEIGYYQDGQQKTTKVKLTLEASDQNTTAASNEEGN